MLCNNLPETELKIESKDSEKVVAWNMEIWNKKNQLIKKITSRGHTLP